MNRATKSRAFTLVELIVVITILVILGTISLVSIQGYVGSSQDGARITDLANIEKGLNMFKMKTGSYPIPEGTILTGSINGVALAYKGTIWAAITRAINISKSPADPLLVSVAYQYGTTADRTSYQVSATIESGNSITQNPLIDEAYAAGRNRAKVNGDYPGYIKFSTGSSSFIANVPSLVYNFTGSVNDLLLDKANVYFVVNKGTNLPYKLDADTDINDKSGDLIVQELRWATASLMQVDITGITPATLPNVFTGSVLTSFGDIATVQRAVFGKVIESAVAAAAESVPFNSCTLVKNIASGTTSGYTGRFSVIGNTVYFGANDGTNGMELWKSDGTEAGTTMVKNINTTAGASSLIASNYFWSMNGVLYTFADDGSGIEPWKSDGTSAGTVRIMDIYSGGSSVIASESPIEMNGALYFRATTAANGQEIWKTDGTQTTLLKDIGAGATGGNINSLTNINGTLYFRANDGTSGDELWKSDGSSGGTAMVKDIHTSGSSTPAGFTEMNGLVYFRAIDAVHGLELWKTDGTEAGTVMVKDIRLWTTGATFGTSMINFNGMIYFTLNDGGGSGQELWRTDGTEAGTVQFMDIYSGSSASNPQGYQISNGLLYFRAANGTAGDELWRTDGTEAGTFILKDIRPGTLSSAPIMLPFTLNGWSYFIATTGTSGYELWRTDGTEAGTTMIRDMNPGSWSSSPNPFSLNGSLYMFANDGTTGMELYKCQ